MAEENEAQEQADTEPAHEAGPHGRPRHAHFAAGSLAAPPAGAPQAAKKQHRDNMILILVAVIGVFVTYMLYRRSQGAAAAASTTPTTSTGTVAGYSGSSPYADQLAGSLSDQINQQGQAMQGLSTLLSNLQGEIATLGSGPGPSSNPSTQAPMSPSTPGYGTIDIQGSEYAILGEATPGASDYQVGGGAPVFFGNANSIAQGKAAQSQAAATHGYEYVPIDYSGLIGSAPGAPAPGQPGYKAA